MTQKPRSATRWQAPANPAEKARTAEKLTAGVPLAKLIRRKLALVPELVMLTDSRSLVAEKFRRLKTILEQREDSPQAIVITSSTPNDGKSFVSTNLALAFAAEKRGEVLLIDADLRRRPKNEGVVEDIDIIPGPVRVAFVISVGNPLYDLETAVLPVPFR